LATYRVLVAIVLLALPVLAALGGHDATDARREEKRLSVGQVRLVPCKGAPKLWCGSLNVPLDRDEPRARGEGHCDQENWRGCRKMLKIPKMLKTHGDRLYTDDI
jgi:hypothetical protein